MSEITIAQPVAAASDRTVPDYESLKGHFFSASGEILESEIILYMKIKNALAGINGPMKYVHIALLSRQKDDIKLAVRDISNIFRHSGTLPRSILASLKKRFPRYEHYNAAGNDSDMSALARDHRRIAEKIDTLRNIRFEIVDRNLTHCLTAIGDKHERAIWMLNAAGAGDDALTDCKSSKADAKTDRRQTEQLWT